MFDRLLDRVRMDDWRGDLDGRPVFWSRTLWGRGGWRISLHRMVDADAEGCFHSHPAHALRLILAGGYVEQMADGRETTWRAGRIGHVSPELTHRIARLLNGRVSYSLWIRGPKRAPIRLVGEGWPEHLRSADV